MWTQSSSGAASRADARDAPRPAFLDVDGPSLVIFGGKGGVGKTTCAVATALELAASRPDERVLLVSTDPAHSVRHCLAGDPTPDNLDVDEIDVTATLEAFLADHRRLLLTIARRGTFLDDEHIQRFLSLSLPGLDEVLAFLTVGVAVRAGRYAKVVVDTAPTGHTLRLLEMSGVLRAWLDALDAMLGKHRYMKRLFAGSYERDEVDAFLVDLVAQIEQLEHMLRDREHTRFVPVSLAQRLSISETGRLLDRLAALSIPVEEVVLNQVVSVPRPRPANVHREHDEGLRELGARFPGLTLWTLPLAADEVRGADRLRGLWSSVRSAAIERSGDTQCGQLTLVSGRHEEAGQPVADPAPALGPEVELAIIGGKGGVGKTTLACATALAVARGDAGPARRVLLLSADPAHSIADCLGVPVGGTELDDRPVQVAPDRAPGLYALEVDGTREFQTLVQTYRSELAGVFASRDTQLDFAFDREVMERLFDLAPPGVDEIAALTRVMDHLGGDEFDLVVVDAAPTGHLLRLLEMPAVLNEWLVTIFSVLHDYRELLRLPEITDRLIALSRSLKRLRARMADATRAQLYVVTQPTEVAAAETLGLLDACQRMDVHAPVLFVNLVTPPAVEGERPDPLRAALRAREGRVLRALEAAAPDVHQTVVYRQLALTGVDALATIGAQLFSTTAPPGGRS